LSAKRAKTEIARCIAGSRDENAEAFTVTPPLSVQPNSPTSRGGADGGPEEEEEEEEAEAGTGELGSEEKEG
jgi:hypothetical protein